MWKKNNLKKGISHNAATLKTDLYREAVSKLLITNDQIVDALVVYWIMPSVSA